MNLKLNELVLFEQHAGMSWSRAAKLLVAKPCQEHRLAKAAAEVIAACERCEAPDAPMSVVGTLAWLMARRETPSLSFETFAENASIEDVTELLGQLGNAGGGAG